MEGIFSHISLADVHQRVMRNIVSIHSSQDLFDDLSPDAQDWAWAQQVEEEVKPPPYKSSSPLIDRPFEQAAWCSVIEWPFTHWQASRYSTGQFGVWYGSDTAKTSVFETAYHWLKGLLQDAGFDQDGVVGERKIHDVGCDALLWDLRKLNKSYPGLVHPSDYGCTQMIGARLHREGHPGLVAPSARYATGHNYVIFTPAVLSEPRFNCQVSYRLDGNNILVEKQAGTLWMTIDSTTL